MPRRLPRQNIPYSAEENLVVAYQREDHQTALVQIEACARIQTFTNQPGGLVKEINGIANGDSYSFPLTA